MTGRRREEKCVFISTLTLCLISLGANVLQTRQSGFAEILLVQQTMELKTTAINTNGENEEEKSICAEYDRLYCQRTYPDTDYGYRQLHLLSDFLRGHPLKNGDTFLESVQDEPNSLGTRKNATLKFMSSLGDDDLEKFQISRDYFSSKIAVCQFFKMYHSQHNPHALQQLIRCMSWWRAKQQKHGHEKLLLVLLWPSHKHWPGLYSNSKMFTRRKRISIIKRPLNAFREGYKKYIKNDYYKNDIFMKGLLRSLIVAFDLLVTTPDFMAEDIYYELSKRKRASSFGFKLLQEKDEFTNDTLDILEDDSNQISLNKLPGKSKFAFASIEAAVNQSLVSSKWKDEQVRGLHRTKHIYEVRSPTDVQAFVTGIQSYYGIKKSSSCTEFRNSKKPGNFMPKIAILNRKYSSLRHLINVQDLASSLEDTFYQNSTYNIPITYFENRTFFEQISFFSSLDIVIAPHGAQVTALSFMPSCGSLMEIFPNKYCFFWFFGTLAESSGVGHYSACVTKTGNIMAEMDALLSNESQFAPRRMVNVCADISAVVDGVQTMIRDWRRCCDTKA